MVNDSKAEALEAKGLYRRAATRWQEVMMLCAEDDDREPVLPLYSAFLHAFAIKHPLEQPHAVTVTSRHLFLPLDKK